MNCRFSVRQCFALVSLTCFGLLGFGLYLQHAVGLEPCPMCVLQRYADALIALIALLAAVHAPRRCLGQGVYGALIVLTALAGAGVAARQSWLQWFPPQTAACGPDAFELFGTTTLSQWLPMLFSGSGSCEAVEWTFLRLSIANWSFLWFVAIALLLPLCLLRKK